MARDNTLWCAPLCHHPGCRPVQCEADPRDVDRAEAVLRERTQDVAEMGVSEEAAAAAN